MQFFLVKKSQLLASFHDGKLSHVLLGGNSAVLAIVKKIVELHNGKIWVESPVKNGKGSRFCFTIPVTKTTSDHHDTHKVMAGS